MWPRQTSGSLTHPEGSVPISPVPWVQTLPGPWLHPPSPVPAMTCCSWTLARLCPLWPASNQKQPQFGRQHLQLWYYETAADLFEISLSGQLFGVGPRIPPRILNRSDRFPRTFSIIINDVHRAGYCPHATYLSSVITLKMKQRLSFNFSSHPSKKNRNVLLPRDDRCKLAAS